jgi:hypothetical protein
VKEPKVPQTPSVSLFYPVKLALKEMGAFDRLDDRWLAILMCGADVSRGEGALQAVAFQLPIHRLQPFEKAVVGVALLVVGRKCHANGRKARPLQLARQIDVRAGHFGSGERNVDVVMGVDPDSLGNDVGNSRIDHIRRPARSWTQHDGGPRRHSNGGE